MILAYTAAEVALPWVLLSDAERRLPSSLMGLLVAAVPLIGVLLAHLTGSDDRFGGRRLLGLLLGLAGVAALVGLDVSGSNLGAVSEVGLVALGYTIGPLIIARRLSGVPALGVVAASLVGTTLLWAPFLAQMPSTLPSTRVLVAVGILGLVCTAVAFLLYFALISEVGPVRATVLSYSTRPSR